MNADTLAAWEGLDSHERDDLIALARRPGPRVGSTLARMERDGLVEFLRETRSGTTWYGATALGRVVAAYGTAVSRLAAAPALADALEAALDAAACDCPKSDLEIGGRGHLADCWMAIARSALRSAGRLP